MNPRSVIPLTSTGIVALCVAVIAYVLGWQLGWLELMVLAAGCLMALVAAIPFVVGRTHLEMERSIDPRRVVAGEPSVGVLDIVNSGKAPTAPRIVEDRVGDDRLPIEIPTLASGGSHQALYNLPTQRRGVVDVGPAVLVKADPLGLMRREIPQTGSDTLWIHPRTTMLESLPVGFAKDLEGPTSDASPAGDVAFHTLREYQFGDDYRHIHWLSTARTGTLMVRHYVDNRRPQVAVLLDDRAGAYRGDEFEVAVEVAASLVVSSVLLQQPVAVWFGAEQLLGEGMPGSVDDVMDRLALVEPRAGSLLFESAMKVVRKERGASAFVPVTGGLELHELMATVQATKRSARVVACRTWLPGERRTERLPGAQLFDVDHLDQFRVAWNRMGG